MSSRGGLQRVPNGTDDGYNITAPGANTNILSAGITPKYGAGIFRVFINLAVASVVNYTVTDGTTAFTAGLNSSVAIGAGDDAGFDFSHMGSGLGATYTYNFQVETDGVIRQIRVYELMPSEA